MLADDIKIAFQSLRSTKWRSFLTMLGVIVGVVSVAVIVSIGIGIKQQVSSQINQFGSDLITILPGTGINSSESDFIRRVNLLPTLGDGSFTERDLTIVGSTNGVSEAIPLSIITGNVAVNNTSSSNYLIVATTDNLPSALNQNVSVGQFFTSVDDYRNVAVIGHNVAEQLFHTVYASGQTLYIRGQSFIVEGVFSQFATNPLLPVSNYNNAIFIPFGVGSDFSGGNPEIYQIYAKPSNPTKTADVAQAIQANLQRSRGGQLNFTVLDQKQNINIANQTLNLLTTLVAGVAAISLLVGGIGIMNIMLVSVTERTREIGIRKAVGATNKQIFSQFLIESATIGFMGGVIGVIISILIDLAIKILTSLRPAINLQVILLSIGIGLVVGVIFGVMPAMRAASRDPIDSLRHD